MRRTLIRAVLAAGVLAGAATGAIAAPVIVSTPTDAWTAGVQYQQTQVAQGGTGALTWSVSAGTLPPGLRLGADGVFGGTPEESGRYSFTIAVADADGNRDTQRVSMTINPPVSVASGDPPAWTRDVSVSTRLFASGGTGAITWSLSAGALPDGVSLSEDGTLAGTPEKAGTFSFTVLARDTVHATGSRSLDWRVNVPPSLGKLSPAGWSVLRPFDGKVTVKGGTAPFSWSLGGDDDDDDGPKKKAGDDGGSLPAGLDFFPSPTATARVAGKATESGKFSFDVKVRDARGAETEATLEIEIHEWPLMETKSVPGVLVGVTYDTRFEADFGTDPFRFRLSDGALPEGIALAPTGELSGAAKTAGAYDFTVEATDTAGATASRSYTLVVSPALTIDPVVLPEWTRGEPFPATRPAAHGGSGKPGWEVRPGLPVGMTLREDGTISGTPASDGVFDLEIVATDPTGYEARTFATLVVNDRPRIPPVALAMATEARPWTTTVPSEEGTGPFTWRVTAGSLPDGVELSFDGRAATLSGTPEAAGGNDFTLEVRDRHGVTARRDFDLEVREAPVTHEVDLAWTRDRFLVRRLEGRSTVAPYAWRSVGTLPPGLLLVAAGTAGQVTGTPTEAGEWEFAVELADDYGVVDRFDFRVVVNPPVRVSGTPPVVALGRESTFPIAVEGGTPPFDYEVADGRLPPGTRLDREAGEIVGRAAEAGEYPVTLLVGDAANAIDRLDLTIHVAAPLAARGRTDASISSGDGLRYWFADAGRGSRLSLDVKFEKTDGGFPGFALFTSDGRPVALGDALKTKRRGYRLKKLVLPETDRYYVRLDNEGRGYEGPVKLKLRSKPARRVRASGTLVGPDFEDEVTFAASAGSELKLKLRASESIAAGGLRLVAPSGREVFLESFGKLKKKGRAFKAKGVTLDETGDWRLVVNVGGPAGWDARLRLKTRGEFHLGD